MHLNRLILVLACTLVTATDASAATITVTNIADSGAGTLRQAMAMASSGDTIAFSTNLSGATIRVTSGHLTTGKNLRIDASGVANGISISGNGVSRIFEFENSTSVIVGLTFTNGASLGGHPDDFAGAIYLVSTTMTISNCAFVGNRAVFGGGIYNEDSALTVSHCIFASNSAGAWGGAITSDGSTLTIHNSTFTGNTGSDGGCLTTINSGAFVINDSTFAGNSAANGGCVYLISGTVNLKNSTLTGNSAHNGGAIANGPGTIVTLLHTTLAGNLATNLGGGIYNNLGAVLLTNSIVAGNTATNISGTFAGANSLTGGNPLLAPPGNYGGPTRTMPPLPGSPAIDAGDDSLTNMLGADQRGMARLFGAHVDIGAVEGVFDPEFRLVNPARLADGTFQFGFANLPGAPFEVVATGALVPVLNWQTIGVATETAPGQFQFTDPQAPANPARYYRAGLRWAD